MRLDYGPVTHVARVHPGALPSSRNHRQCLWALVCNSLQRKRCNNYRTF